MVQKVKKRTLFFFGVIVTGLASMLGIQLSSYGKEDSLLTSLIGPEAHADASIFSGGGDGSGGCSAGGDSGDCGGGGGGGDAGDCCY